MASWRSENFPKKRSSSIFSVIAYFVRLQIVSALARGRDALSTSASNASRSKMYIWATFRTVKRLVTSSTSVWSRLSTEHSNVQRHHEFVSGPIPRQFWFERSRASPPILDADNGPPVLIRSRFARNWSNFERERSSSFEASQVERGYSEQPAASSWGNRRLGCLASGSTSPSV